MGDNCEEARSRSIMFSVFKREAWRKFAPLEEAKVTTVPGGSVLERVLAMAVSGPVEGTDLRLEEQIAGCKAALEGFLPVEASAGAVLRERLANLCAQQVKAKYPQVSLEVLDWRDEKGLPKLALFDCNRFAQLAIFAWGISPPLPLALDGHYRDVQRRLKSRLSHWPGWLNSVMGAAALSAALVLIALGSLSLLAAIIHAFSADFPLLE